jgi:predicted amidohydrolase
VCKGWKILPQICYDLRFPVWSRQIEKEYFDLIIYTANWPEARSFAWKSLLPARAIENQSYVTGCNRIGTDGTGKMYAGDSVVLDYKGRILSEAGAFVESVTIATLEYQKLHEFRDQFRFLDDADSFSITNL